MKIWTYLADIKSTASLSRLTQNPLTFEHVEIDDVCWETRIVNLTNGYIDLINEGFFDGFTNDYNMLFVSKYDPTQNPIEREKLFEMEFMDLTINQKNKKQKTKNKKLKIT